MITTKGDNMSDTIFDKIATLTTLGDIDSLQAEIGRMADPVERRDADSMARYVASLLIFESAVREASDLVPDRNDTIVGRGCQAALHRLEWAADERDSTLSVAPHPVGRDADLDLEDEETRPIQELIAIALNRCNCKPLRRRLDKLLEQIPR